MERLSLIFGPSWRASCPTIVPVNREDGRTSPGGSLGMYGVPVANISNQPGYLTYQRLRAILVIWPPTAPDSEFWEMSGRAS